MTTPRIDQLVRNAGADPVKLELVTEIQAILAENKRLEQLLSGETEEGWIMLEVGDLLPRDYQLRTRGGAWVKGFEQGSEVPYNALEYRAPKQ